MTTITATRGSDVRLTFTYRNAPVPPATVGTPVDLTGRVFTVFDASASLAGRVAVTSAEPETGVIDVFIEGTDPLPIGPHAFRVQIEAPGGDSVGLPSITLQVV
jgi:hypothetical protein